MLGGYEAREPVERPYKRRKIDLIPIPIMTQRPPPPPEPDESGDWLFDNDRGQGPDIFEDAEEELEQDEIETSNREELIECIKRGQKPRWVPKPALQALCEQEDALHEHLSGTNDHPPARPPSALHRGDFSDASSTSTSSQRIRQTPPLSPTSTYSATPPPWLPSPNPPGLTRALSDLPDLTPLNTSLSARRRAPSLGSSISSSFIQRVPTSPLVNATTHHYSDSSQQNRSHSHSSFSLPANRRRTMPPHAFQSWSLSVDDQRPPNFSRPFQPPSLRLESSMPHPTHQTHQMRRSMSSFTYHPRSTPQTPTPRSRHPSMSSEGGSQRRASMVGSFEESILRGRMSTPPSKPLNFVAQIGVMGKGDCPANLKCPPHVTVNFPAVFYSYPSSGVRSIIDDTPSPYVGTIDLENSLKPVVLKSKTKSTDAESEFIDTFRTDEDSIKTPSDKQRNFHLGGAYRVPKQGQLQIIIKNPNKTAVKLFLVPYDLQGMEPGTKTFVRQRSFSSGPVIENALGDTLSKAHDPLKDKLILRYLIHLKFCCPSKGKFYLYEDIRAVFANRVPDGKERLQNEIQLPEPRFSPFKSVRRASLQRRATRNSADLIDMSKSPFESHSLADDIGGHTGKRATSFGPLEERLNEPDPVPFNPLPSQQSESRDRANRIEHQPPFQFPDLGMTDQSPMLNKTDRPMSPIHGFAPSSSPRHSPLPWRAASDTSNINRSFSPIPEAGDGLLSRQLKQLQALSSSSRPPSRTEVAKDGNVVDD